MYQTIIIVGRLGGDPEMRYTPAGKAVTNFSVATDRKYSTSDGQLVEETTWFRVSTWGKSAENCSQYLHKGNKVLVEGRLVPDKETGGPRVWTRQDGTPAASFEVSADNVRFLSSKGEGNGQAEEAPEAVPAGDDIPF